MRFKLKETPDVRYSAGERQVFSLLSNGPANSTDLIKDYYRNLKRKPPHHARESLTATINGLNRKLQCNGENFMIEKGDQGPWPMQYRIVERK